MWRRVKKLRIAHSRLTRLKQVTIIQVNADWNAEPLGDERASSDTCAADCIVLHVSHATDFDGCKNQQRSD